MSFSAPLACRLDAFDAEGRRRYAMLRAKLGREVREIRELPDGLELSFPADPGFLRELTEWMALERLCCPFLQLSLSQPGGSDRATLRLTGPPGTKDFLQSELADAMGKVGDIGSLRREELPELLSLLDRSRLPLAGVEDHLEAALVAREDGRIVGSAVLEIYGLEALLRSVAVERSFRGRGLGIRLSERAIALARERGVQRVFLLTETAAQFFRKLGFRVIFRSEVPESVQRSAEFTGACPESAVAMEKRIAPDRELA